MDTLHIVVIYGCELCFYAYGALFVVIICINVYNEFNYMIKHYHRFKELEVLEAGIIQAEAYIIPLVKASIVKYQFASEV